MITIALLYFFLIPYGMDKRLKITKENERLGYLF
jgi:hypothetical protein